MRTTTSISSPGIRAVYLQSAAVITTCHMHRVILEAVDSLESSCNRDWAKTKAVVVDGVLGLVSLQ